MDKDTVSERKKELGSLIKKARKRSGLSQRSLARKIDLPNSNSNLKYIEDGVNAPSPLIYDKIIQNLELYESE